MNDFIEELFASDISEAGRYHAPSSVKKSSMREREEICIKLEKRLSEEDFALFEEYCQKGFVIDSEDLHNAFADGIRFALNLFIGVYGS